MTKQLLQALDRCRDLKIVVLGDLMLDVYDFCYSGKSRPSPERPGKRVYQAQKSLRTLGGAGNVAANLAALEVATVLISACGADGHSLTIRELAEDLKIHQFLIQDSNRPTTIKTRLYIDDEYILRRDDECTDELQAETKARVLTAFRRELKGADAVVLSDYAKGFFCEETAQEIIAECCKRSVPVIVDFKPCNKSFFRNASVIAPNRSEAEALLPGFNDGGRIEHKMGALYDLLKCSNIVVTLGEDGICGFNGATLWQIPANKVPARDAVGCGDTVRAGLALGMACGLELHEAMKIANDAAAIAVQKIGTAVAPLAELRAFIAEHSSC